MPPWTYLKLAIGTSRADRFSESKKCEAKERVLLGQFPEIPRIRVEGGLQQRQLVEEVRATIKQLLNCLSLRPLVR
jgi:hypothetical protein